jgi:hypothetical protein
LYFSLSCNIEIIGALNQLTDFHEIWYKTVMAAMLNLEFVTKKSQSLYFMSPPKNKNSSVIFRYKKQKNTALDSITWSSALEPNKVTDDLKYVLLVAYKLFLSKWDWQRKFCRTYSICYRKVDSNGYIWNSLYSTACFILFLGELRASFPRCIGVKKCE